jgi:hypothetical protein
MKINQIIGEAPIAQVGQSVGKAAFNVGKTAGQAVQSVKPAVANAKADAKAIGRGVKSGLWAWGTGQKPEIKNTKNSDAVVLQRIIDNDTSLSAETITQLQNKLPTMKLNWKVDRNTAMTALAQAADNKPLDVTQINSLKVLKQNLEKV